MKNDIINELKNIVEKNENENNIIFLWDYVYHFSYDRVSLLELFNFFSNLYKKGKNIYVMSWNHDWIWEHFVYEESEKILSLINNNKIKKYYFFHLIYIIIILKMILLLIKYIKIVYDNIIKLKFHLNMKL
jgi:hypothetical protein